MSDEAKRHAEEELYVGLTLAVLVWNNSIYCGLFCFRTEPWGQGLPAYLSCRSWLEPPHASSLLAITSFERSRRNVYFHAARSPRPSIKGARRKKVRITSPQGESGVAVCSILRICVSFAFDLIYSACLYVDIGGVAYGDV
jgi:hypothetical protein